MSINLARVVGREHRLDALLDVIEQAAERNLNAYNYPRVNVLDDRFFRVEDATVALRLSQGGTGNPDECPACHKTVYDYDPDGFESNNGQRGHYGCGLHPLSKREVADLNYATRSGA